MYCPRHVAIIMDGNGRWAKGKGMSRASGHKQGANAIREVMESCEELGISYLTIYAFSSENWKRSPLEVQGLMELLRLYLDRELKSLHKRGVCLKIIGDKSRLAVDIQRKVENAERLTAANDSFFLVIAVSYGSRQEIAYAARALAKDVAAGEVEVDTVDEELFGEYLYTAGIPEPDLLIRTGGEQRLSNFLLWQSAYTELYFTPVLWPDFGKEAFLEAVEAFGKRDRRFGDA